MDNKMQEQKLGSVIFPIQVYFFLLLNFLFKYILNELNNLKCKLFHSLIDAELELKEQ